MIQEYLAIDALNILSLLLLQYMFYRSDILRKFRRRVFLLSIILIVIVLFAQIGTTLFDNSDVKFRTIDLISNVLGFAVSPFIPVTLSYVIIDKSEFKKLLTFLPAIINAVFSILSIWFDFIFTITATNAYSRQKFFFVFIVSSFIGFVILAISISKVAEKYQFKAKIATYLILAFVILGVIFQIFYPKMHTAWTCASIGIILYYAMLCEQNDRYDIQTMLLNRRTFEEEIKSFEKKGIGTYILFDVDDFKTINDTYGHMFGDFCLVTLAQPILDRFEGIGYSFRIGGDEFCTLAKTDDEEIINKILTEIAEDVEKKHESDNRIPRLSYGYRTFRKTYNKDIDMQLIMQQADRQMYKFKNRKKVEN